MKSSKAVIDYDEIQRPSKTSVINMMLPFSLIKQIPTSETVLQGHRDSVNTLKFNGDLTFLLSGGTYVVLFVYTQPLTDA